MRSMRTPGGSVGTEDAGVTVTVAVLLPATGSAGVLAVMVAVFEIAEAPATVATIANVCDAPVVTVPTLHSPVPAL